MHQHFSGTINFFFFFFFRVKGTINFFHVSMPSPTFQLFNFFIIIFVPAMATFSAFITLSFYNGRIVFHNALPTFPLALFFSLLSPFLQVMADYTLGLSLTWTLFFFYIYIYIYIYILITFLVSTYYLVHNITDTFFQFQQPPIMKKFTMYFVFATT